MLVGVRYRGSPFMDLDARLAAMDAAGIDLEVLSPNPLTSFAFVEADWADPSPAATTTSWRRWWPPPPTGSPASPSCRCRTRRSPPASCAAVGEARPPRRLPADRRRPGPR
ncbi:MAG: hypothetical protein R2690_20170 [Acidimicrobiales bacterium]